MQTAAPSLERVSGDVDAGLGQLEASAWALIDDLAWWTEALKTARSNVS